MADTAITHIFPNPTDTETKVKAIYVNQIDGLDWMPIKGRDLPNYLKQKKILSDEIDNILEAGYNVIILTY